MRTVGIICEYNPFHTGHKRQIDILRSMGYDCIICVMSGNYTERGEFAIFDKYTRAKSAVYGGADLVLELPFPYSSFSAEGFADSGVHILSSIGAEAICFGSECGDISYLERAAQAIISPSFADIYHELQKGGLGSACAYFEAIKKLSGDIELHSNDILAISYIAAIQKQNSKLKVIPIKRDGIAYNEKTLEKNKFPSATAIREVLRRSSDISDASFCEYIPRTSYKALYEAIQHGMAPVLPQKTEKEILSFFRIMLPKEIETRAISRSCGGNHIAEDGCGILDRICRVAKTASSLYNLLEGTYNKKYTDARINRVLMFSLLGVSDKLTKTLPEFTILLAANKVGRDYLSGIRKSCDFPIITKPADAPDCHIIDISRYADSLYSLAIPCDVEYDYFIKKHPFMY